MPENPELPPQLSELVSSLDFAADRSERIQMLIEIGERYRELPETIAARPYDPEHRVPGCESEAYVWARPRPDGRLDFHIAVENPQGLSARAMAVILSEQLSGAPLDQVAGLDPGLAQRLFGRELSLGKSMGLEGMVAMVRGLARRQLEAGRA